MDYEKIYSDFIQDRKEKSKNFKVGTYTEGHHIIPRSLGGSNSKSNIVNLTPEDHFFAHILLAKIHGGKMMRALFAMSNLRNGCEQRPDFSKRMQYGYLRRLVAREYSEKYSGINSAVSDKTIYEFINHDGRIASGNRFELELITGINRSAISQLINEEKKNYKGWYYPEKNPGLSRKDIYRMNSKSICRKIRSLYHFDGSEWSGTKLEFEDKFSRKLHFQSKEGSCSGWYRTKEQAENHFQRIKDWHNKNSKKRGDISGINNPRFISEKYDFINFKTLERKLCTRIDLASFLNIRPGGLHCLFSRRQKTVKSWGLYEVFLVKDELKTYREDRHGKDRTRAGL